VVRIASQLTDVAGRLATVYDQVAQRLLEDGCPVRHAADSVLSAGDQLRRRHGLPLRPLGTSRGVG
jgi:hypothetical protein